MVASSYWRRNRSYFYVLTFGLALIWSLAQTTSNREDLLNEQGWKFVGDFLNAAYTPSLSIDFLALTAKATLTTLAYAVVGTFGSLLLGVLAGVFSSQRWWQAVTYHKAQSNKPRFYLLPWLNARALLVVPRGIHELVWGLFFVGIFGLDPLTAILAIAIPYGAITAKVFSEILDETPPEPYLAILHSGSTPWRAILYGLIPESLPDLLSYTFYSFESAIRSAAVLGIIGAGGLGFQLLLSFQSLNYEEIWTLLYALILLSTLVEYSSNFARNRLAQGTLTSKAVEANVQREIPEDLTCTPSHTSSLKGSLLFVPGLFLLLLVYLRPDFSLIWSPRTWQLLNDFGHQAFPPNVTSSFLVQLLQLSGQTLAMSILAAGLSTVLGLAFAVLGASNYMLPEGNLNLARGGDYRWRVLLWRGTRFVLLILRTIPIPVWALILVFVLYPGILPGALALTLYTLGVLGRLMAEAIENQDARPLLALRAQGATLTQTFLYGSLPTIFPQLLAYSLSRWEVIIRATVIVGFISGGGLGRLLTQQLSSFDVQSLVVTLLFYVGLVFVVDMISSTIRREIHEG